MADNTVHRLILGQCERTPDRVSITCGHDSISYATLRQKVLSVASSLHHHGVMKGDGVGLYCSRSIDFVITALAILEAGAFYVPLNPELPEQRLSFIVEDAGLKAVIYNTALPKKLLDSVDTLGAISFSEALNGQYFEQNEGASLDDAAYVIYTSGSTGQPKGVEILHESILSFRNSISLSSGPREHDTVVSVAAFSFDMSGFDIYPALSTGAHLVIATDDETRDGRLLAQLLERHDATLLKSTPATWHLLLQSGWQGKQNLKLVSGGDALTWDVADSLLNKVEILWNVYGPTEATVHCTEYNVSSLQSRPDTSTVPIGKPLTATTIYLLNENGEEQNDGEIGELYIGGLQVAKGYLNRPELNQTHFSNDRYDPLQRMYRSGDRACRLEDGNIEFIGRTDHQVKVRGYRIDLSEISSTLQKHQDIQEAIVVLTTDSLAGKRLIAYFTKAQSELTVWSDELRDFLEQYLPEYMLPSAYVVLASMPLTISGKPDRKLLPALGQAELAIDRSTFEAEASSDQSNLNKELLQGTCNQLSVMWEDILGFPVPSIYHDFFSLGGHSILAMQLLHKIEEQFSVTLPLSSIYPKATVSSLSREIARHSVDPERSSYRLVPIKVAKNSDKPTLFIVHPVSGQISIFVDLAVGLDADQSVYAFESNVQYPAEEPSIESLANTYIELMKKHQPNGPYYLAGPSMGAWVAFEMAIQLTQNGDEVAFLGAIDSAPKSRLTTIAMGENPILDEAQYLAAAVMTLRGHAHGIKGVRSNHADFNPGIVRSLSSEERWMRALQLLREGEVVAEDFPDSQVIRILKTLMAHTSAFYRYKLPSPGDFPVTVIVNTHPSEVPYKVWNCQNDDGVWGWSHWTTRVADGPYPIEGGDDHWTLLRRPESLLKVAKVMQASISQQSPQL